MGASGDMLKLPLGGEAQKRATEARRLPWGRREQAGRRAGWEQPEPPGPHGLDWGSQDHPGHPANACSCLRLASRWSVPHLAALLHVLGAAAGQLGAQRLRRLLAGGLRSHGAARHNNNKWLRAAAPATNSQPATGGEGNDSLRRPHPRPPTSPRFRRRQGQRDTPTERSPAHRCVTGLAVL